MYGRNPALNYICSLGWPVWIFLFFTGYYAFNYSGILYFHTFPNAFDAWANGDHTTFNYITLNSGFAIVSVVAFFLAAFVLLRRKKKGIRMARAASLAFAVLIPAMALSSYIIFDDTDFMAYIRSPQALVQVFGNFAVFMLFSKLPFPESFT